MKPSFRLARSARRDFQQISDYCAREWGPDAALSVVTRILETIIRLSGQPKAGVTAEQFGVGVRKFPAGTYMIYYRLGRSNRIEVLHMFHGARDQVRAWKDQET